MGLKNLIYFVIKRAKKYKYTEEEFESDLYFSIKQHKEKTESNKERETVYLLKLHENENKRLQSYNNRKEIKAGKKESYRMKKFKAWQERKRQYNRVN